MQRASERDRFKKNRVDEKTFVEVREMEESQTEKIWVFYFDALDEFVLGEK